MKRCRAFGVVVSLVALLAAGLEKAGAVGGGYQLENCSIAEATAINAAFQHLLQRIGPDYGHLVRCMLDAPIHRNDGQCGDRITDLIKNRKVTYIKCENLDDDAGSTRHWRNVLFDTEKLKLDREYIDDYKESPEYIASVIAHELMHNYDFHHGDDRDAPHYPHTVPEQMAACVLNLVPNGDWPGHNNNCDWNVFNRWWNVSDSITTKGQLHVGDFNGDGISDVLFADGSKWQIKYGADGPWVHVSNSTSLPNQLKIGDFNGDGKADVLLADGSGWRIKYGAGGGWVTVSSTIAAANQLRIGDFNGDNRSDVLFVDGNGWKIKYGAQGAWDVVSGSVAPIEQLRLGDFDGDGKSDVLHADGATWKIKYGAKGGWKKISDSDLPASELIIGDFDNDFRSDVLNPTGDLWRVKYSAEGPWIIVSESIVTADQLLVGHFRPFGFLNMFLGSDLLRVTGSGWNVRYLATAGRPL